MFSVKLYDNINSRDDDGNFKLTNTDKTIIGIFISLFILMTIYIVYFSINLKNYV